MKPFSLRGPGWLFLASLIAAAALAWTQGRDTNTHAPIARAPEPAREPKAATVADAAPQAKPVAKAADAATPAPKRVAAQRAPAATKPVVQARASVPASVGGQVIAIDPETGLPGAPSPEQMEALRAAAPARATVSRSPEGLRETRFPDGTVMLELDERFQEFAVVRVDKNGKAQYGCVHDRDAVAKTLRDTTAVPALEDR